MKKILATALLALLFCVGLFADTIILKDEQMFEADVQTFDSFFLVLKLPNGNTASVPWGEVKYIKHTTTASSWLEETYMNGDDVEVTSMIVPRSPDIAMQRALFPGIVMHGAGHFYAKDTNMGMSLLSAEIVSLILMGISVNELLTPSDGNQASVMNQAVFFTGLTLFGGSWLFDVIFSGGAAVRYNEGKEFLTDKKENK